MKRIQKISIKSLTYNVLLLALALGILRLLFLLVSTKINPEYVAQTFPAIAQTSAWNLVQIFLIVYPLTITVGAIIVGFIYNLVARKTGGISVDLK